MYSEAERRSRARRLAEIAVETEALADVVAGSRLDKSKAGIAVFAEANSKLLALDYERRETERAVWVHKPRFVEEAQRAIRSFIERHDPKIDEHAVRETLANVEPLEFMLKRMTTALPEAHAEMLADTFAKKEKAVELARLADRWRRTYGKLEALRARANRAPYRDRADEDLVRELRADLEAIEAEYAGTPAEKTEKPGLLARIFGQ